MRWPRILLASLGFGFGMVASPTAGGPLVSAELRFAVEGFAPITVPMIVGSGATGSFNGTISSATVRGPFSFDPGSAFAGTWVLSPTSPGAVPTFGGLPFALGVRLGTGFLLTGDALHDILNQGGGFTASVFWAHPLGLSMKNGPLPLGRPVVSIDPAGPATGTGGPWGLLPALLGTFFVTSPASMAASSNLTTGGLVSITRVTPAVVSTTLPLAAGTDQRMVFAQLSLLFVPEAGTSWLLLLATMAWLGHLFRR